MSQYEEKLRILKKKKLTAKIIVEQQRNELRVLKSSLSIDERIEQLQQKFHSTKGIEIDLMTKILNRSRSNVSDEDRLRQTIVNLSKLLEYLQEILSLKPPIDLQHEQMNVILTRQKDLLKFIQWKLSDLYAHRVAEEVSCITS